MALTTDKLEEAIDALNACGGDVCKAARQLGVARDCLRSRLKRAKRKGFQVVTKTRRGGVRKDQEQPKYLPTPWMILLACRRFQRGWTDAERIWRGQMRCDFYATIQAPGQQFQEALTESKYAG